MKQEERKDIWLSLYAIGLMGRNVCRVFAVRSDTKQKKSKKCWGQTLFYYFCLGFFPALVHNLYRSGKNRNSVIYKQSGGTRNNPLTHRHPQTIRTTKPTQPINTSTEYMVVD